MRPKKSLGQNFLIDQNIIKKIIFLGKIKNNNILEIGPGTGNLTKYLLEVKNCNLTLIEKDTNLVLDLKEKIVSQNKVQIINNDILKFDLEKKIKSNTIIFGNLPYNISTKILTNLIKFKVWPPKYKRLVLMFQKEVAEKIEANFNTKNYGRLCVLTNFRLKISDSFNISKNCFYPKPKVDSCLLVFEPINNSNYEIKNLKSLEDVTRILFSNKRKMINKGFNKLFKDASNVAKKIKIDLTLRPSQLTLNNFYKITEFYEKTNNL
jgi:16S rRNA (adenine1518-N6/adenine1519-N6)-dimethyltransferase